MKHVISAFCYIALCSTPGFTQSEAVTGPAMTDQQFIDFAAQVDMIEANLGQLAQSVSPSQSIKDYAQMLVTDHTKEFNQLYDIARQAGLMRPNAIDAAHNKMMIDPFQKLKGEPFDHRYIQEMVNGHTKAIAVYKKESADAENPALKSYAEQVLPILQKHLDEAKVLQKSKTAPKDM